MSGVSDSMDCPYCKGDDSLMIYQDYKPYDYCAGECINCGFAYYTKPYRMDLAEVNELRADRDLPELKKLPDIEIDLVDSEDNRIVIHELTELLADLEDISDDELIDCRESMQDRVTHALEHIKSLSE